MALENEEINGENGVRHAIELTLLGTGTSQGIPVIGCKCHVCVSTDLRDKRLRTAAFIKAGKTGLAIDIGPDFRAQMLNNQIDDVHAVLLTHEHNDHISGLDDLRPINFRHQRNIPVYGSDRTLTEIERRFYYAFDEDYAYPGKPRVHGIRIGDQPFQLEDITIQPVPVDHGDLLVYGFRIDQVAYVTDAKTIPSASMDLLKDLDVLVLNALRFRDHPTHLTVPEAIEIYEELKPKRCFLVHISHDMGIYEEVSKKLPDGLQLGYDGLVIKSA